MSRRSSRPGCKRISGRKRRRTAFPEKTFQAAFAGVTLNWDLPDLAPPGFPKAKEQKQTQAEFSSPAPLFQRGAAAEAGGNRAQLRFGNMVRTLKRIEKVYGVPGPIVLAIWGRETGFGAAKLPNSAIQVLATKAFMSTRKEMFRTELIAALGILEHGDVTPAQFMGSWAGALGQPQFMPTSYLKYAVDFDGDGHRNIWTSVPDTLASIANYLVQKGWQRGRGWGYEVTIPENVSCAQERPDLAKPISQWTSLGIARISGKAFPSDELRAGGMMLVPAGRDGPEFIVTPNFYVIKEYNNSDLYGLYIGNLADRIAYGSGAFQGQWGDVGKMLRSDVASMQMTLQRKGYDVGGTDGLPGYKTRRSIGQWQQRVDASLTCYPDSSMLGSAEISATRRQMPRVAAFGPLRSLSRTALENFGIAPLLPLPSQLALGHADGFFEDLDFEDAVGAEMTEGLFRLAPRNQEAVRIGVA